MKKPLTCDEVIEIRRLSESLPYREIAERFGLKNPSSVSSIVLGRSYKDIKEGIRERRSIADTIRLKWGEDFYQRQGVKGGSNGTTGGFYANRELAREAGRKGGMKSRRRKASDQES